MPNCCAECGRPIAGHTCDRCMRPQPGRTEGQVRRHGSSRRWSPYARPDVPVRPCLQQPGEARQKAAERAGGHTPTAPKHVASPGPAPPRPRGPMSRPERHTQRTPDQRPQPHQRTAPPHRTSPPRPNTTDAVPAHDPRPTVTHARTNTRPTPASHYTLHPGQAQAPTRTTTRPSPDPHAGRTALHRPFPKRNPQTPSHNPAPTRGAGEGPRASYLRGGSTFPRPVGRGRSPPWLREPIPRGPPSSSETPTGTNTSLSHAPPGAGLPPQPQQGGHSKTPRTGTHQPRAPTPAIPMPPSAQPLYVHPAQGRNRASQAESPHRQ